MDFLKTLHSALDFFFCDRCPAEAREEHWISKVIDKFCPVQFLFRLLPKEARTNPRRIYFPRSWMEGTHWHWEDGLRE